MNGEDDELKKKDKIIYYKLCIIEKHIYLCIHKIIVIITILKYKINMDAYKHLQTYNIKPSVQRIAIMDYLLTHKTHPNVEEIYTALSPAIPTLSKTTVYNTLKLFTAQNAALLLTIDEKNVCFDGDTAPHAHFLCKCCNKIYDLPLLQADKELIDMEVGGHIINEVHSYYRGICKNCLEK